MKCPKCSVNHQYKLGMSCTCGYHFIFNPKTDGMTDGKFTGVIRAASANDTYYYTLNQLWMAYRRKTMTSPLRYVIVGAVLAGLAIGFAIGKIWIPVYCLGACSLLAILGGISVYLGNRKADHQPFEKHLKQWREKDRSQTLSKLIEKPSLEQPPPEWAESDIYDYGVERLLIVERDLLVDLLVKNNFHAEQRALVIAESGYPSYLQKTAQGLLDDNPDLPVFLWHDSTRHGQQMEERVRQTGKPVVLGEHHLIDMGLHPGDVRRIARLREVGAHRAPDMVPADILVFAALSVGMATALENQMTVAQVIDTTGSGADGGGDFG